MPHLDNLILERILYIAAAVIASYYLIQWGAPWYAVLGGVLLAGHFNWRRARRTVRT